MFVSKTVGEFRNVNGNLVGYIASGDIDLPRARLRPIRSNNPRAPKFEVEALNRSGRWLPYGALFEAVAKNSTGEIFYAGELDDHGWRNPLQIALFGTVDEGFRASWRRDDMDRPARSRNRDRDDDQYGDGAYEGDERSFGGDDRSYGGGFGGSTAPLQGGDDDGTGSAATPPADDLNDDKIPF